MKRVIKKHPLAIRWFHWINFPVIAMMVWSGMLIYWANDVYRLGWGNKTLLKFFPNSFYEALHIKYRLAEGMGLHFFFMWFFGINGILYVLYLIISGEWRLILPNKKSLKESLQVVLHDLHLRKEPPAQKKYNAAQRIAYTGVIVMGAGSLLTGLSIYKPIQFHLLCTALGGYETARVLHFTLTILFTLFFLVHIIQVILAGWGNFRSMVTGLEVLPANIPQKDIAIPEPAMATIAQTAVADSGEAPLSPPSSETTGEGPAREPDTIGPHSEPDESRDPEGSQAP
ncbi:MAG: cytochrome b/b6 domain-containing protein [Bacteroidota bacterium]|nr:cytochrome b/b6 domain-containing protein [Bacteroidota bacterium]